MKLSGIEVYTVGFDLGDNQTAIGTLQSCAAIRRWPTTQPTQNSSRQLSAILPSRFRRSTSFSSVAKNIGLPAKRTGDARKASPLCLWPRSDATRQPSPTHSSSKPASTSATSAWRASGPCGPSAVIWSSEPGPAASIINPMIDDADRLTVANDSHVGIVAFRAFHELGRGARVQPLMLRMMTMASGRLLFLSSGT